MNLKLPEIPEGLKKYLVYLWPTLAVLMSAILLITVIIPQSINYFSTTNLLSGLNARINNLNSKASVLNSINAQNYQENIDLISIVLPQSKDIPSAISQIQSALGASNMQLNDISFSNGNTTPDSSSVSLQNYQIKLDISGSPDSLKTFMDKIKGLPQVMKITGLDISSTKPGNYDATVTLMVYYQKAPSTLEDIEQPVKGLSDSDLRLLSSLTQKVQLSQFNTTNITLPPRGKANPFQ